MSRSHLNILIFSALSLSIFSPLPLADAKCSDKTLKGTYIYASTGIRDGVVYVEAGQELFDGKGGIVNTYTDLSGALIETKGVYDLDQACIGQAMYENTGDKYDMYTGPSGSEFSWISVSPGTKINGRDVRVSSSLNPQCSDRTLKGTYVYSHVGYKNGIQYIESGQDVFDGQGGHVNTFTDAGGLTITTSGTYSVERNCIGKTFYEDTRDSYSIYVDPKGTELRYAALNSKPGNAAVGSMRRVGKEVSSTSMKK